MTEDLELVGLRVSPEILKKFRQIIFKEHGKIHGFQTQSFEEAMKIWILFETDKEKLIKKIENDLATSDSQPKDNDSEVKES